MSRDTLIPASENRAMFDSISGQYDRMNGLMSLGLHRGWRRKAVSLLAPHAGGTYLDIGAGTGDLTLELLRQEPAARVIAIDPAARMLELAEFKFEQCGIGDRVIRHAMDFMDFEGSDNSVDGIVSGFCIRNIEKLDVALARMKALTRPSGRVVALELTRSGSRLMRLGCRLYNRSVMPLLATLLSSREAYRYLADSIDHFPEPAAIRTRFEQAGFRDVTAQPLNGGVVTLFSGKA